MTKKISTRPQKLVELSRKTIITQSITVTAKSVTPIQDIESAIKQAFFDTLKHFTNAKTFREQDFRNSFYHHLISIVKKEKMSNVEILSDHIVKINSKISFKPDVTIYRDDKPTVVIELKNVNVINGKIVDYSTTDGIKDIEKMKLYAEYGFQKGYFIHLDKSDKEYSHRLAEWKDNFLRDFCFILDEDTLIFRTYKAGKKIEEIKRYV
jgi:hypothetical protein